MQRNALHSFPQYYVANYCIDSRLMNYENALCIFFGEFTVLSQKEVT